MSIVHVVPKDDLIAHEERADTCVCMPHVEFVPGGMVVIHAALDGRERPQTPRSIEDGPKTDGPGC